VSLHADLIAQARHLCQREPRRPKQASLRRAISTAYYGLFHGLVAAAGACFLSHRHRALRPVLTRAFEHRKMAEACQRLLTIRTKGRRYVIPWHGPGYWGEVVVDDARHVVFIHTSYS
jgi:hypothetical protein